MHFAFTEEQQALREAARDFLAEHSGSEAVRGAMETELGYDPGVWKRIATELGWPGVIVPEAYGGIGLGPVELTALMEVMGEALLCAPFFSSVCLGASALLEAGDEEQKRAHLPAIAEGAQLATLAFGEARARWDAEAIGVSLRRDADGYRLTGRVSQVIDGHCAELLVVAAREEGSLGEEGVSLFLVPADATGVARRPLLAMDQTRRRAEIAFDDVRVSDSARLGEEGSAWPALRKTLDLAAIALAAEQVGGAQRCLDLSVAYAKERVQFGRPIGSFQAIKHKCADMMVEVEAARSAAYYAACVAAEDREDLGVVASLAQAYCSEAYFHCAAESIQIHGGVGFTWEYDPHLHFKRARASEADLGTPAYHRERVARGIGL